MDDAQRGRIQSAERAVPTPTISFMTKLLSA
jgi:hypothetical protein